MAEELDTFIRSKPLLNPDGGVPDSGWSEVYF